MIILLSSKIKIHLKQNRFLSFSPLTFPEFEEPDHDDKSVGGAILVRLQAAVGTRGVRGRQYASCALRSHLATRYCTLQQVSAPIW